MVNNTFFYRKMKINIILGDITKLKTDAIVNSAHSSLSPGSGVCGAIHLSAGPKLAKECREIIGGLGRELNIGEAVITKPYDLSKNGVKLIIHTLTPRSYTDMMGDLGSCYENSLEIAKKNGCKSIAFPALATGAHGLDIEKSARYAKRILGINNSMIEEVILVLANKKDEEIYLRIFNGDDIFDSAGFCAACLSPISDVLSSNHGGWYCSEECAEKGGCYSKKNEDALNDIISAGLMAQKRNDLKE